MYVCTTLLLGAFLGAAYAAPPTEYGLDVTVVGGDSGGTSTTVPLGSVRTLRATISVPNQESLATKVELLSSVLTTRFAIGNIISMSAGTGVSIGNPSWQTYETSKGNDQPESPGIEYNTRVVFDLGTVNTDGSTGGALADYQINIDYEVIYVSDGGQTAGDTIQTSAGIELKDGSRIIISMLSFTSAVAATPTGTDSFVISGPSEIVPLTETVATLTINVPRAEADTTITVTSDNDKVVVQEIVGKSVGTAYDLYVTPSEIGFKNNDSCPPPATVVLSMGKLINTNVMRTAPDTTTYDIEVDIKMKVIDGDLVNQEVFPAVTVNLGGSDLYVNTINMTVLALPAPQPLVSASLASSATVPIGHPAVLALTLTTQRDNIHTDTITVSVTPSSGARSLSILAVNPVSYGMNVCPVTPNNWNVTLVSANSDAIKDSATVNFRVTNFGAVSESAEDELVVNIVVMATAGNENDIHNVEITPSGLSPPETVFVTYSAALPYPSHVNYNISIEPTCAAAVYEPATIATYKIRVETEPNVVAGPFTMEFPIPPGNVSDLAIVSITATKIGANVVCMPLGELTVELSDWVENSGENDRGVVELPLMCNIETSADPEDNAFEMEAKFQIKDIPLQTSVANLTLGGGIKYSESQVWVVITYLLVNPPTNHGTTKMITAITVPVDHMPTTWPGDVIMQWSPDNENFYPLTQSVTNAPTITQATDWTITFARPFFARYTRVINTQGKCMKDHSYITADAFPMYSSNSKMKTFMQSSQLFMDGDVDTCVDLPLSTETVMTPFMWVELKKGMFGFQDTTSSFTVNVTGEGIQCRSRSGPQVTYVVYPKETPAANFRGKKLLCTHTGNATVSVGKTRCEYHCPCVGTAQCSQMSLFMMHKGSAPPSYKLCEVQMALD